MKHIQTEVLVIGGGATGTGIARDLAMRGFKTVLVERRDLTHGTTGRHHGLLHSGGRYVVKDPQAAHECMEENRILRKIMPHCIEDTGGFFVLTPWDDPSYVQLFIQGCQKAGIPCEEVSIQQMLRQEPLLNPKITHCFHVPDGSADSFLAADLNAESARQHGANILTYHEVTRLIRYENEIAGAFCHDLVKDEKVQIDADLTINAAGAWTGIIAGSAGIFVQIIPGKGTMVAINHRVVNTVINRCKMPSDGDILVPAHTVAVMGTTDIKVNHPDQFGIEPWEIRLMLEEGEKIVPGFSSFRLLRAWAGVRPLYNETNPSTQNRSVSRSFVLLDHEERDGLKSFLTITSGKWTTYRKMAETTVDKACEKLNTMRPCKTHLEPLPDSPYQPSKKPGSAIKHHHNLSARLAQIEKEQSFGHLICECELATQADVTQAIIEGQAQTLDDIRRDVRLGMGPCQGGFCTLRAAGLLHQLRHPPVFETNAALRDFLQERWKGLPPILWGQQLRQERLNELIYRNILNVEHLPGPKESSLKAEMYSPSSPRGDETTKPIEKRPLPKTETFSSITSSDVKHSEHPMGSQTINQPDVLVIGAGMAGLIAGWLSARKGKKTTVIAKGWGAMYWSAGCLDVLGYHPATSARHVNSPLASIRQLIEDNPLHPYALAGEETTSAVDCIAEAISEFQELCIEAGYPLRGSLSNNWLLPTAAGAQRPTCLAPETMIAGDLNLRTPILIVGFAQFPDFYPALIAENLNAQAHFASDLLLDLPSLQKRRFTNGMVLARLFDTPEFRAEVAEHIKPHLANASRVGFPAALGIKYPIQVQKDLEDRLGVSVFEIPGLPPSIPGIRLHNILKTAIRNNGGNIVDGMQVIGAETQNGWINFILSEAAARSKRHLARNIILATGGILGGGTFVNVDGYAQDTVFGIQISLPTEHSARLQTHFITHQDTPGHPIFQAGIRVDKSFRPVDQNNYPIYHNLRAIGSALDHCDPLLERSLEGIAIVSAYAACKSL